MLIRPPPQPTAKETTLARTSFQNKLMSALPRLIAIQKKP